MSNRNFKTLPPTEQLTIILTNLRKYTKIWNNEYGNKAKDNKVFWENKSDEWLKENLSKQHIEVIIDDYKDKNTL